MKRVFIWIFTLLLLSIGFIFIIMYYFAGLGRYLQLRAEIRQLPSQQAEAAERVFDDFEVGREYRGIVGYIDLREEGGVMVWGRNGPKYFKGDEHTVYSVFSACNELILSAKPDDGPIAVETNADPDDCIEAVTCGPGYYVCNTGCCAIGTGGGGCECGARADGTCKACGGGSTCGVATDCPTGTERTNTLISSECVPMQ